MSVIPNRVDPRVALNAEQREAERVRQANAAKKAAHAAAVEGAKQFAKNKYLGMLDAKDFYKFEKTYLWGMVEPVQKYAHFSVDDRYDAMLIAVAAFNDLLASRGEPAVSEGTLLKLVDLCQSKGVFAADSQGSALNAAYETLKAAGLLDAVVVPEPELESEPEVNPFDPVKQEYEYNKWDREKYQRDLREEQAQSIVNSPVWREAIHSLADSSNLTMNWEQQIELFNIFRDRARDLRIHSDGNTEPTVAKIRKCAYAIWGDAIGLTPAEQAGQDFDGLSAEQQRRLLNRGTGADPRFQAGRVHDSRDIHPGGGR